jgi:NifU-like protein involved in Fe-S cluster formation
MSDLRELYRDMVMDHNRKPRNFRKIESRRALWANPLWRQSDRVPAA